jgi:hypothetical protein
MAVVKRRRTCEDCGHKHHEGVFCHVYTEAGEDNMDDPDIVDEDEDDDEDDDEEESFSFGKKKSAPIKRARIKPLPTPLFARMAGFVRCNCDVGVPNDSLKYEPLPRLIYNGKIQIQTYFEINEPMDRARFEEALRLRLYSPEALAKKKQEGLLAFSEKLPLVLSFLPYGYCSPVPKVCTSWNYGANLYKEYIDMRNCVPWQVSYGIH